GRGHNALALAAHVLDTGFTSPRSSCGARLERSAAAASVPFVVAARGASSQWSAPGDARDLVGRVLGEHVLPVAEHPPDE
ncbi:hypothetical protein, partial [Methylobacterium crusticola]|uniref:hypothetical protein n=1 Tax=Methylobacterium crusticola TaxID=1697972 RepID=UPI001EE30706